MGWRKEIVEQVVAELEIAVPELESVEVFNEDVAEGIAKGRVMRAPFAIVNYVGFSGEALGERAKREIVIGILFGVNGVRGEQSGFKGDNAPPGSATMDIILEKFEEHFWGLDLGTNFPAVIRDESFEGTTDTFVLFSVELVIQGIFSLV